MLNKIKEFLRKNSEDIILVIFIVLISLLSFALGFIFAKIQEKKPIKIEKIYEGSNRWGWDFRSLSSKKTF